jgi:hypothetical protein
MTQKKERLKPALCLKCGQPAQVHAYGKRAGTYSIYCFIHLKEQRVKNRARSELSRWIQTGGDSAAWMAVTVWKAGKSGRMGHLVS